MLCHYKNIHFNEKADASAAYKQRGEIFGEILEKYPPEYNFNVDKTFFFLIRFY